MLRIRVAALVGLVAIAALDFGAIRAWSQFRTIRFVGHRGRMVTNVNNTVDVLAIGGLPMANILVVGSFVARRRGKADSFLPGFLVFGLAALLLYISCAALFTEPTIMPYLHSVLRPMGRILKRVWPGLYPSPILNYVVAALMLLWPQLVIALVGGAGCRSLARSRFAGTVSSS